MSVRNSSTSSIVFGLGSDQTGEAPSRDHVSMLAPFLLDTIDQSVNQRRVAEDEARLDCTDGRAAYGLARAHQLDLVKFGRVFDQRIHRDSQSRRDRAAHVLAAPGDVVEGGRGAEIDHDRGAGVAVVGRYRVDDTVRAHLFGIFVQNRHPGLDSGTNDQRLALEVAMRQLFHRAVERRHHTRNRHALGTQRRLQPNALQKRSDHHPVLVSGAFGLGRKPPVMEQAVALVDADYGVGVADIYCYQHRATGMAASSRNAAINNFPDDMILWLHKSRWPPQAPTYGRIHRRIPAFVKNPRRTLRHRVRERPHPETLPSFAGPRAERSVAAALSWPSVAASRRPTEMSGDEAATPEEATPAPPGDGGGADAAPLAA